MIPESDSDMSIDALVGNRSRILETKLAVFAAEIVERINIRQTNLESLLTDELHISNSILSLPYHLQSSYQINEPLLQLSQQRRSENIECWRDVVAVMREFLATWEALQQSQARALFLHSAALPIQSYSLDTKENDVR